MSEKIKKLEDFVREKWVPEGAESAHRVQCISSYKIKTCSHNPSFPFAGINSSSICISSTTQA